jgi:hypothetical protein
MAQQARSGLIKNLPILTFLLVLAVDLNAQRVKPDAPIAKPEGGTIGMTILNEPSATATTTAGRPAWQWTVAERIAARCNPEAARVRVRGTSPGASAMSVVGIQKTHADVISGKTHPELFLPTELFEAVVRGAFLQDGWREVYATDIAKVGLPSDFLALLERISASYLPLLREQEQIRSHRSQLGPAERAVAIARLATLDTEICSVRHTALLAARARFGVALDRFLYGPVARSRTMYFDELSDTASLTAREKGCR